jgi:hypothetical protein
VPLYSKLDHDSSEYIGKKAGQRITLWEYNNLLSMIAI